jgi:2-polyprenyl-3-methyl-5-hydroxy-6-metoxy-1,4-benzoquinol methylase
VPNNGYQATPTATPFYKSWLAWERPVDVKEPTLNPNRHRLNEEGRNQWNRKATFWDALHGAEGNAFHRHLVSPAVERLLDLKSGERVLDIACGSGVLARRLAHLGGRVMAVDFSARLIEHAQKRGQTTGEPIHYQVVDVTDEGALVALGEGEYEAVVSTMALMDIPVITPLFRAVCQLLKASGRFVFATAHPAFNSNNTVFVAELEDEEGDIRINHFLKIEGYLDVPPTKAAGARGESTPHYLYHRPLHELLGEAFAVGMVLDGLEEPSFGPEQADSARPLSWDNLWQIPPVMVGRMRVMR